MKLESIAKIGAGLAASALILETCDAIKVDIAPQLRKNAQPTEWVGLLHKKAAPKGEMFESAVGSVCDIATHTCRTYTAKGEMFGVSESVIVSLLDKASSEVLKVPSETSKHKMVVLQGHNHTAKIIEKAKDVFGIDYDVDYSKILTGPSGLSDCVSRTLSTKINHQTKNVSVVVDPGGVWLCNADEVFPVYDKTKLRLLRVTLAKLSQNTNPKHRMDGVKYFEGEFKRITGIKITFLDKDFTNQVFFDKVEVLLK